MSIAHHFVLVLLAVAVLGYSESSNYHSPQYAKQFSVAYGQDYKLVTNKAYNIVYCLYEGDVLPDECNQEMIENESVHEVGFKSREDWTACVNTSDFNSRGIEAAFTMSEYQNNTCYGDNFTTYATSTIIFSDYMEQRNHTDNVNFATAEWILYVSYFYNKEEKAEEYMRNLYGKWDCLTNNLKACNKRLEPLSKKVAFIPWYKNGSFGGPSDNTYYAELIEVAASKLVTCRTGTNSINALQLAECIHFADVCIFQVNYTSIERSDRDILENNVPCIKNNAYFDVYGARGKRYERQWLRNAAEIQGGHFKQETQQKCLYPDFNDMPAPITPFECVMCNDTSGFSISFMLFLNVCTFAVLIVVLGFKAAKLTKNMDQAHKHYANTLVKGQLQNSSSMVLIEQK